LSNANLKLGWENALQTKKSAPVEIP